MNQPENNFHEMAVAIHQAPLRLVLAVTGGGSMAMAELLKTPGASQTVLEAVVPYASSSLNDWLGAAPEHYCCAATARAMAMQAFERARQLADDADGPLAGVAATCSLASDRPKRGAHRFYAALQTAKSTTCCWVELTKDIRTRGEEETLVAQVLLNLIAAAAEIPQRMSVAWQTGETLEHQTCPAEPAWTDLLLGRVLAVWHRGLQRGTLANSSAGPKALLPGSFNPLHAGHVAMAHYAAQRLGMPVEFELSTQNVDKPSLDFCELWQRRQSFSPKQTLWLTRAPTFVEKARLFPGTTFVVGADTISRIGQEKYYHHEPTLRDRALQELHALGTRFLVFGRQTSTGFQTLVDLSLPPTLLSMCAEVTAEEFRHDISSTELRRSASP